MIRGVAVVWMPIQNIERAKGFYRDTLELRIANEDSSHLPIALEDLDLPSSLLLAPSRKLFAAVGAVSPYLLQVGHQRLDAG